MATNQVNGAVFYRSAPHLEGLDANAYDRIARDFPQLAFRSAITAHHEATRLVGNVEPWRDGDYLHLAGHGLWPVPDKETHGLASDACVSLIVCLSRFVDDVVSMVSE